LGWRLLGERDTTGERDNEDNETDDTLHHVLQY